jgi:hypothetical protein
LLVLAPVAVPNQQLLAHAAEVRQAADPVPPQPLPTTIDLIDRYEGQTLCDPTPKQGTLKLRSTLWSTYGSSIWAGISRDCDVTWDRGVSEHKDGRAIDWGVNVRNPSKAIGDAFFTWATMNNGENARRAGIMYIIWDSRMWRLYDMGRGFTEYRSCVSTFTSQSYDTTCHRDHMHISMTWHGAGAWTSWYDGTPVTAPACSSQKPANVKAGSSAQPSLLFDSLAALPGSGTGPCYLGSSIQTLKLPVTDPRGAVQRLRIARADRNSPSPVKIWTNAGARLDVGGSARTPAEADLLVASDGLIFLQQPVGQASVRLEGIGMKPNPNPFGQLDSVTAAGPGRVRITGWAADPNTPAGPITVRITVNGTTTTTTTGKARPDVAAAYPGYGTTLGYDTTLNAPAGPVTVCATAINTGPGTSDTPLGCRTTTIATANPFGQLDSVTAAGPGRVRITGWAADPNTPNGPIAVHLYVNGGGTAITTGTARPDVAAAYPGYGTTLGYDTTLNAPAGPATVCAYAINTGPGDTNTPLGCRTTTIP